MKYTVVVEGTMQNRKHISIEADTPEEASELAIIEAYEDLTDQWDVMWIEEDGE
ncbi:MAG: hypothetical protein WC107_05750 [Patescibacteria group bacterium]|jgi:hypothetical protein